MGRRKGMGGRGGLVRGWENAQPHPAALIIIIIIIIIIIMIIIIIIIIMK